MSETPAPTEAAPVKKAKGKAKKEDDLAINYYPKHKLGLGSLMDTPEFVSVPLPSNAEASLSGTWTQWRSQAKSAGKEKMIPAMPKEVKIYLAANVEFTGYSVVALLRTWESVGANIDTFLDTLCGLDVPFSLVEYIGYLLTRD